ncbi:MAG: hypothetical protein WCJ57_02365 [Candidatus Falkowbacteria bacterium]
MKTNSDVPCRQRQKNCSKKASKRSKDQALPVDEYIQDNYQERLTLGWRLLNGQQFDDLLEYPF